MNYLHLYKAGLPFAVIPSFGVSYFVSLSSMKHDVFHPHTQVMNILGLVSVGTMIGLAYPITVPLLAGRYLYRNRS
jgi:hypothetical protein